MAEDSADKPPQDDSETKNKPAVPPAAAPRPAQAQPVPPAARPATPLPPRPAAPGPVPAARPPVPKDSGRRNFVKALFVIGAILSIIPFVPWGEFLSSSAATRTGKRTLLQKVVVDAQSKYGAAAGQVVNVNDLQTFPSNSHWIITYPTSGDKTLDAQNPDTFMKYELIRLPAELGGESKKATDFVAFSKVCVHLWCSPNYNPTQSVNSSENGYMPGAVNHMQFECPCHGSIYEVPDGKAVQGPASLQPAPTNAIPMLTLQADSSGVLYAVYPGRDPTKAYPNDAVDSLSSNGLLGYGRNDDSYKNFINPVGQVTADPKGLTEEIKS